MTLAEHAEERFSYYLKWKECTNRSGEERAGRGGGFFPVSMSGHCGRSLGYAYNNIPKPPHDARTERRFEHGSWFEDVVRYQISKSSIKITNIEQQLKREDIPLIGHIDGVVWCDTIKHLIKAINGEDFKMDKKLIKPHHLELKTSSSYGIDTMKRDGIDKAQPAYIAQQQIYLDLLKKDKKLSGINDSYFIFEKKDTNELVPIEVGYDERLVKKVYDRLERLHNVIKKGELPDQDYAPTDWHCKYCDYNSLCWKGN